MIIEKSIPKEIREKAELFDKLMSSSQYSFSFINQTPNITSIIELQLTANIKASDWIRIDYYLDKLFKRV